MSLPAPEPLGVDTSLDDVGDVSTVGIDAPDLDNVLPMASSSDFATNMSDSSYNPYGFSQAMKDMNSQAYAQDDSSSSGGAEATGTRAQAIKLAKSFLGTPYVWGGTKPGGFDCSGLVQYVTGKMGLHLPRISADQARSGKREDISSLQPGDLVAWDENSRNNGADHIAFYIGNGMILEAPHTGAQVRIRKLGKNEGAWGVALNYPK